MSKRLNLLFLSHRNAARSILAEAAANRLGRDKFRAFSAGVDPVETVDPLVLDILHLSQYPTEALRTKSWKEFATSDAPALDFVFTLCDLDANEPPPRWAGLPVTADWRYPDPANDNLDGWERRKELSETLRGLERQLGAFMLLPFESLDAASLRERIDALREQDAIV